MPKTELYFEKPIMNAAGTLGFSPDPKSPLDISGFGAFVTNPVSLAPRTPAKGERWIPYSGGFLMHTGYPNPGLKTVIRSNARRWARAQVPVIVHLLAQNGYTLGKMVQRLEGVEGIIGVEVGLPPDVDPGLAHEMALAALGELFLIVRVPFEHADHAELLDAIVKAGASAVSLAPPRGALPGANGVLVTGRLYGPGLLPQALVKVQAIGEFGIPVIASAGVYQQRDVESLLNVGAVAVQLDSVLWRGGWPNTNQEARDAI
jgi:dihydroorotate dehydrogenase (NAD+) catalytic subunit